MQRLLVVEDESDIADLLRHVFSKEGFQVDVARDGVSALEALRIHSPDLVVLDWMLPELSGIDVLKEMRARQIRE
jgi:DNA-binding response OmpR family regulator